MASLAERLKKFIGAGASGRKKRLDHAIDQQSKGNATPGSTLGNPSGPGFKRKKKKRTLRKLY